MPDNEPDSPANAESSASSASSSSTGSEEGGTPSSINQKHAAAIGRAEDRARAAQKGAYAPALAAVGLAADFPPRAPLMSRSLVFSRDSSATILPS